GWKAQRLRSKINSPSPDTTGHPTSVIVLATVESAVGKLCSAVSYLCTSYELAESEKSVLKIEQLWPEAGAAEQTFFSALAKPAVIRLHGDPLQLRHRTSAAGG
ncbi:hypothetical protein CFC21_007944, partial [Triticum aestivum]